jgi:glycerophosphoryl diester phosphodiesterase
VVADAARTGLGLYVDIKDLTPAAADRLVQHLNDTGMAERVILASKRPAIVELCATVAPGLPRAILFSAVDVDPVALAGATSADFVHPCWEHLDAPHELLDAVRWLDRVRRHGLGVISWHEERRPIVEALYVLGIDGVCSDEPALLSSVASDPQADARRNAHLPLGPSRDREAQFPDNAGRRLQAQSDAKLGDSTAPPP